MTNILKMNVPHPSLRDSSFNMGRDFGHDYQPLSCLQMQTRPAKPDILGKYAEYI